METLGTEPIRFRPYAPEDMPACTRMAWNAWALGDEEPSSEEEDDPSVMEGYVRSFLMRSNWNEVAYDDSHGIVGFLFGRLSKGKGRPKVSSPLGELEFIPRFLFGGRRREPSISPLIILHFFLTEFKVLVNVPKADAEVNLLIVDKKHRGKRLGSTLVDRFVEEARRSGCNLVTLYTDDQMSNWKFYEIYGFAKVAEFDDSLTTYFSEHPAKGIVYALDLRGGRGAQRA